MGSNVENPYLERRFDITNFSGKLQDEIENRLKRLAKDNQITWFSSGKVPLRIITQMYGVTSQQDVLNDAVHKEFKEPLRKIIYRCWYHVLKQSAE